MPHLRVSLGFATGTDHNLEEIAGAVSASLYGNPAFPAPPVTKTALDTALQVFTDAIAAQAQGGTAATADKNNKRDILIGLLRQDAGYVQANHHDDLALLLSTGFDAVSTTRTPGALTAPNIKDILNGNSGQLIIRVAAMKNIHIFELRYAALGADGTPGPWLSGGLHTDSRRMPVDGLTPGVNYMFQARAVGGHSAYSDWSDSVNHRSL